MVQDRTIAFISYLELYLQCYKIEGAYCLRIWSIEQRHFQRPWTTINPDFKVTPLLMLNISETVRDTDTVSMEC